MGSFFTPERSLAFTGIGDILKGGTGGTQLQGLRDLQQQEQGRQLWQSIFNPQGAPNIPPGGVPSPTPGGAVPPVSPTLPPAGGQDSTIGGAPQISFDQISRILDNPGVSNSRKQLALNAYQQQSAVPELNIERGADGRLYYVDPTGRTESRAVNPDVIPSGLGQQASVRSYAPVPATTSTGEKALAIPTFDPNTGQAALVRVDPGEDIRLARETARERREADIEAAAATEKGKLRARQRDKISTEIGTNARQATRQIPIFKDVLRGLELTGTGKLAEAKRVLGPYLPGVDPSNEQALVAAMNDLAFEELQRFTGAISDAERRFAQQTTASLGNTVEANRIILNRRIARLEAVIDESDKYRSFIDSGGSPEDFQYEYTPKGQAEPNKVGRFTVEVAN